MLGAEYGEVAATEAEGESDDGAEGADGRGFGEYGAAELPAAGTDGAETAPEWDQGPVVTASAAIRARADCWLCPS